MAEEIKEIKDFLDISRDENKELKAGYKFIFGKYKYTTWELRVIYNIIYSKGFQDKIQLLINKKKNGEKYGSNVFPHTVHVSIPLNQITQNKNEYNDVWRAFCNLDEKSYKVITDKKNAKIRLLVFPTMDKVTKIISFDMMPEVCESFIDISKGFRNFEFRILCSLTSSYSMRFYAMFAHQDKDNNNGIRSIKIERLKEILQFPETYLGNITMLKKRILEPARTELNKVANYSFNYELTRTGLSRKYDGIKFQVIHIPANDVKDAKRLENKEKTIIQKYSKISIPLYDILLHEVQFQENEIKSNTANFILLENVYKSQYGSNYINEIAAKLFELKGRALRRDRDHWQAYVIGAIKKITADMEQERRNMIITH